MDNQTTQAGVAIESTPLLDLPCPFCGSTAKRSCKGTAVTCSNDKDEGCRLSVDFMCVWFEPDDWNRRSNNTNEGRT
jgi:hypothetical protein